MSDLENVRRIQQAVDGLQIKMSPYRRSDDHVQRTLDRANYELRKAIKELQRPPEDPEQ